MQAAFECPLHMSPLSAGLWQCKWSCVIHQGGRKILVQLWAFFTNSSKRSASYAKAAVAVWFKKTWGDSSATGLLQQIVSIRFLLVVYLLHEVLPPLSHLSKEAFQWGTVSFSAIEPAIKYTTDQITEIATERRTLLRLKEDLGEGGRLSDTELTLTHSSESYLESLTEKYINSLKDKDWFPESLPVLSAFKIFNPTAIPDRSEQSFMEYNIGEIHILAAHFYQDADDQERKQKSWNANGKSSNTIYFS